MVRKMAVMAGAAWLALAASGCSPQDQGSATDADRPIQEGTQITGSVNEALRVGPLEMQTPTARPFSVRVENGRAALDSGGLVALTRGLPRGRIERDVVTPDGQRGRIEVTAAGPGQPVQSLRQYRDGRLSSEIVFQWTAQPGGWTLRGREIKLYVQGREVLRHARTIEAPVLAHGRHLDLRAPLAALGEALLPTPAEAQIWRCMDRAVMVIVADVAVAAATAALIGAPGPITLLALMAAIGAYERAAEAYVVCLFEEA